MLLLWGAEKFTQTYVNYIRDLPGMPCHLVHFCGQQKVQRVLYGYFPSICSVVNLLLCLLAKVAFKNGWKT